MYVLRTHTELLPLHYNKNVFNTYARFQNIQSHMYILDHYRSILSIFAPSYEDARIFAPSYEDGRMRR